MPSNVVKSFAQRSGKSESEVEELWDKAKNLAQNAGKSEDNKEFYPYVVGILKKMLGITDECNAIILLALIDKVSRTSG